MAENQVESTSTTPPEAAKLSPQQQKVSAKKAEFELESSVYDPELDAPRAPAKAKVPETPAAKIEAEKPAASKHNPQLVGLATDLGMAAEEIDDMSPSALVTAVRHLTRMALKAQPIAPTPPPVVTPKPEVDEIDWGVDEDGTKLTETSYAPAIAKTIKANHELTKKTEKLEKHLESLARAEQERSSSRTADTADAVFATNEKLFGKGTVKTIARDTPEFSRRLAALQEAGRLAGKEASREEVLSYLGKAIENLFGKGTPNQQEEETPAAKPNGKSRIKKEDWEDGILATPTQRESSEPKGTARATKAAAKYMRENDLQLEEFDGPEEAGLPD